MSTDSEFGELHVKVENLRTDIAEIKEDMTQLKKDTAEIIEYFKAIQGFFKILELIGKLGKPLMVIGIVGTIVTTQWQSIKKLF